MALHSDLTVNERLQPGARGEVFQANLPGYRDDADRMNRTNMKLNTSEHDVLSIKYEFDSRLPELFKFGFDYGFNQVVIPKGRIVAGDPNMNQVDFDSHKQFSVLTLANGGALVRLRKAGDKYPTIGNSATDIVSETSQGKDVPVKSIGKAYIPAQGYDEAYSDNVYRPFSKKGEGTRALYTEATALSDVKGSVATNGRILVDGDDKSYRAGNKPLGIMGRNEYTRDNDAFNGMMPGPVLTDALVELPYFAYKDKAEQNPWGSVYGALHVGDLVKSDENGRVTVSPLSFPDKVATMSLAEYELERQQVVGQVYAVNHELVPEGAAKWATWALEDRLNSEEFNPAIYAKTNRRGEDAVAETPFKSTGEYPGYPYDKNFLNHDLHMLASTGRKDVYDPRMNAEYQYSDLGIPGLTDGGNVAVRDIPMTKVGTLHAAATDKKYAPFQVRSSDTNLVEEEFKVQFGDEDATTLQRGNKYHGFTATYVNAHQGIVVFEVLSDKDRTEADAFLKDKADGVDVKLGGKKRGLAGVPTFMDWDGCVGSAYILLQK